MSRVTILETSEEPVLMAGEVDSRWKSPRVGLVKSGFEVRGEVSQNGGGIVPLGLYQRLLLWTTGIV